MKFVAKLLSKIKQLGPLALFLAASLLQAHVVDTVPLLGREKDLARGELEFRLPSAGIRAFSLNDFGDFESVLLVAYSREACGATHKNLELDLEAIQKIQGSKSKIVILDSSLRVDRPLIESERPREKFSSTYLFDVFQRVSRKFVFKHAGDFALIEPKKLRVLTTGTISELTSGAVSNGRKDITWPAFKHREVLNKLTPCQLPMWGPPTISTSENSANRFTENFLQPFTRQCLTCHIRSEQFDQFKTLAQTAGWAKMSLRMMDSLRMPGGRDLFYNDDDGAAIEDLRRIAHWLGSEANLKGINKEQSALFAKEYLRLKSERPVFEDPPTSALKLKMKKTLVVPASGRAQSIQVLLGTPIDRPITVQAAFLRTNLNVLHHANLLSFPAGQVPDKFESTPGMNNFKGPPPDKASVFGNKSFTEISGSIQNIATPFYKFQEPILFTFSRRSGFAHLAPGLAFDLPKGSQLAAQLHVEPSGRTENLDLEFEIFERRSKKPYAPLKRFSMTPLKSFSIKPGEKSYVVEARYKTDRRMYLSTVWFHAHYRAVGLRVQIENKSGHREIIFSEPFHQFKMEGVRSFPNRGLEISAGSTIISQIEYDNSEFNLANPDATQRVRLGGSTFKTEMHYPRFVYSED